MAEDGLFDALARAAFKFVQEKTGIDLGAGATGPVAPGTSASGTAAPGPSGGGPAPSGAVPYGISQRPMPSGETVNQLLPQTVGSFTRTRVNDRFGGVRSGGIFAGYSDGGSEVRVLVSLAGTAAAARDQVRGSRDETQKLGGAAPMAESLGTEPSYSQAPGGIVWSRGAYWFSASANGTEGDMPLPATPDDVAALDRFIRAFPY
jgi:hypothetical protein